MPDDNLPSSEDLPRYLVLSVGKGTERSYDPEILVSKVDYTTRFSPSRRRKPWIGSVENVEARLDDGRLLFRNVFPDDPLDVGWSGMDSYGRMSEDPDVRKAAEEIMHDSGKGIFRLEGDRIEVVRGLFLSRDFPLRKKSYDESVFLDYISGNEQAADVLMERYTVMLRKIANGFDIPKIRSEDRFQVAVSAFYSALPHYKGKNNANFSTYISRCVKNALAGEMRKIMAQKRKAIRKSVSMNDTYWGSEAERQLAEGWLKAERMKMRLPFSDEVIY